MSEQEIFKLCDVVRETAFSLHRYLHHGHLEKVYENGLALKACRAITDDHIAQVLGYLRGCRREHGLLINFGAPKLEIRKYAFSDVNF